MCHAILKIKCRVGSKHKNNTSTVFLVLDALAETIFGFGATSLGLGLGFSSSSEEAKKSISESESAFSSASLTGLEETSSSATNGSSVADSSTF